MKRYLSAVFAALLLLSLAGSALAQEEAHYEGYFLNSAAPSTSSTLSGRGLVTAIYAPLASNFVANEYTWVIDGLLLTSGYAVATTNYFTWNVSSSPASFTIYEDPTQNARPTFFNCPADLNLGDPRYSDGTVYLKGHFVSFNNQYDSATLTGTFTGTVNWDSGSPDGFGNLPDGRHGAWTFGSTTSAHFTCIPTLPLYDQAMTGRIFQLTTAAGKTSWGKLRRMYGK